MKKTLFLLMFLLTISMVVKAEKIPDYSGLFQDEKDQADLYNLFSEVKEFLEYKIAFGCLSTEEKISINYFLKLDFKEWKYYFNIEENQLIIFDRYLLDPSLVMLIKIDDESFLESITNEYYNILNFCSERMNVDTLIKICEKIITIVNGIETVHKVCVYVSDNVSFGNSADEPNVGSASGGAGNFVRK